MPRVPTGPGGEAVNDSFYFVRQPLAGDGSITVRVTSLTGMTRASNGGSVGPDSPPTGPAAGLVPWAKAGIIITGEHPPGSAYAAMMVTGSHGVRMQYDYTGDIAGMPGARPAPRWLRLTRSGDVITGYDSADGTRWTEVGTVRLAGPDPAPCRLVCSPPRRWTSRRTSRSTASRAGAPPTAWPPARSTMLSLSGGAPGGRWAGQYVSAGADSNGPRQGIGLRQAGGAVHGDRLR